MAKEIKYVEGETVVLNGIPFKYDAYYKRLEVEQGLDGDGGVTAKTPQVACPCCHGTKFTIGYGNYKCIANRDCGHSMVVYDGRTNERTERIDISPYTRRAAPID